MNVEIMRNFFRMITVTAVIFTGFPVSLPAAETQANAEIPRELIGRKSRKHDISLAISVAEVFYRKKFNHDLTLVDTRSREDFERLHIPGALNIPIYAIKAKGYLKGTPLILINEGYGYGPLEVECRRLKYGGFDAFILDGGLPAWHRRGGELTGDLFALEEMKSIPPKVFFRQKDFENTLVVVISPARNDAFVQLMPYAKHLHIPDDDGDAAARIVNLIPASEKNPFQSVIIVNESGEQYGKAQNILNRLGIDPFTLKGGLDGYRKYLEGLMLSWKPRDDRMKTVSNCRPCGERTEAESSMNDN